MQNPVTLYAVYIVGLVALLLEASAPGVIIPTVIGLVFLTLAVLGFYSLGLSFTGPLLIALAVATFAFTLFQRQFWVWYLLGTLLFLAGTALYFLQASFLWDVSLSATSMGPVLGGALGLVALGGFALKKMQRLYRQAPVASVASRYIGQTARVFIAITATTTGKVRLLGETWPARLDDASAEPLAKGEPVLVVGYDMLPRKTLRVSALPLGEVDSPNSDV